MNAIPWDAATTTEELKLHCDAPSEGQIFKQGFARVPEHKGKTLCVVCCIQGDPLNTYTKVLNRFGKILA